VELDAKRAEAHIRTYVTFIGLSGCARLEEKMVGIKFTALHRADAPLAATANTARGGFPMLVNGILENYETKPIFCSVPAEHPVNPPVFASR
jgi:hypothetical protein